MTEVRVVVLGPTATGKSPLAIRFVSNHFVDEWDPSIEDSYRKQVTLPRADAQAGASAAQPPDTGTGGATVLFDILDTCGMEEYSAMRDQYMRQADVFLLCFRPCGYSRESFEELEIWVDQLARVKDLDLRGGERYSHENQRCTLILVALACDLFDDKDVGRHVSHEEALAFAMENGFTAYIECSSKASRHVGAVFHVAALQDLVLREVCERAASGGSSAPKPKRRGRAASSVMRPIKWLGRRGSSRKAPGAAVGSVIGLNSAAMRQIAERVHPRSALEVEFESELDSLDVLENTVFADLAQVFFACNGGATGGELAAEGEVAAVSDGARTVAPDMSVSIVVVDGSSSPTSDDPLTAQPSTTPIVIHAHQIILAMRSDPLCEALEDGGGARHPSRSGLKCTAPQWAAATRKQRARRPR